MIAARGFHFHQKEFFSPVSHTHWNVFFSTSRDNIGKKFRKFRLRMTDPFHWTPGILFLPQTNQMVRFVYIIM